MRNNKRRNVSRRRKGASWLKRQLAIRPRPIWVLVVADLLILGISLLVFALFHHVLPSKEAAVGIVSQRPTNAQVATTQAPVQEIQQMATQPSAEPAAQATPQPAADPEGYFGTKFADKFTSGEVVKTDSTYQSENLNITLKSIYENNVQAYVVDFYVKDISCLQSAFAKDTFGRGQREDLLKLANRIGSIVAINGDYYGGHSQGAIIRNGVLYRDDESLEMDVGVIYWDGTMKTFSPNEFDAETEIANGAYQCWSFGPELLDENSQPMTTFNSQVKPKNPRTAIGYYEPGHYCFVVVDGRSSHSEGLNMENMSKFMYNLGCKVAYNLDGGASSELIIGGKTVNQPYEGGRPCTDAVVLMDGV